MASSRIVRAALVGLDGFTPLTGRRRRIALATGFEGGRFPAELLRGTPFRSYVGAPTVYLPQVEGLARVTRTGVLVDPPRWDWQSWPCRR